MRIRFRTRKPQKKRNKDNRYLYMESRTNMCEEWGGEKTLDRTKKNCGTHKYVIGD